MSYPSWPPSDFSRGGGTGSSFCPRKLGLGLRPHRGGAGQPGSSDQISDQTVGNILRRNNLAPTPKRSQTTTWREFIRRHLDVLAGTDFFTVEVLTWRGLVSYN